MKSPRTPMSVIGTQLIGQALLKAGCLTDEQLTALLESPARASQRLGEAAVARGFVSEAQLARFLSKFLDVPFLDVAAAEPLSPAVVELIPEAVARRYQILPVALEPEAREVTLAMADPLDVRAVDAVRVETGCRVRKVISARSAILEAIGRSYNTASRLAQRMDHLLAGEAPPLPGQAVRAEEPPQPAPRLEQLRDQASDAPVVQFVNLLLMRAVQERASDIHIEPAEAAVTVRLRVDGQLREVAAPPHSMFQAVTTRIKLLGNLDIAERRLPQDGRFKFQVFDKTIDVRLSSLPTIHGEKLVLRILDRAGIILSMDALGLEPALKDVFLQTLGLPHGLTILTGPTGSGKTTTLYAALNAIRTPTKNIVTIEDPVEYQLPQINQVHTRSDIGLSFAAGLRSILRQDPDVVMVGEIRDRETADICIRAAMTGHLVLSTLHTNDSLSSIGRLVDMGVEAYLLAASLNLVMAQRLVRRVCEECAEPATPPARLRERLAAQWGETLPGTLRRGRGCARCAGTGYWGRVAIYEQFLVTESVRASIADGVPAQQLRAIAEQQGYRTLLHNALAKAADGVTTLEEAFSVCATQAEVLGATG